MFIHSVNYPKVSADKFTNLTIGNGGDNLPSFKFSEESETIGICGAGFSTGN